MILESQTLCIVSKSNNAHASWQRRVEAGCWPDRVVCVDSRRVSWTSAERVAPVAAELYHLLAALVTVLAAALTSNVVTCAKQVAWTLAELADLVFFTAVGSVDQSESLFLGSGEFILAAVIEGVVELRVLVEWSGADHAPGGFARETLADGCEVGAMGGGSGNLGADEGLACAIDALVRVRRVFDLFACVSFEKTRVEKRSVGGQIYWLVVDLDGVWEGAAGHFVDRDREAAFASVQVVDEEVLQCRLTAYFREANVALVRRCGGGSHGSDSVLGKCCSERGVQ